MEITLILIPVIIILSTIAILGEVNNRDKLRIIKDYQLQINDKNKITTKEDRRRVNNLDRTNSMLRIMCKNIIKSNNQFVKHISKKPDGVREVNTIEKDVLIVLEKYIHHVNNCEGDTFISKLNDSQGEIKFTEDEVFMLKQLDIK